MLKKPLSAQVVLVTGASSGLGRTVARLAGERGARVVCAARNAQALDALAAEIEAAGSEALAVPFDAAGQDECAQVVEQAIDRFGRIDTVVRSHMTSVYAEFERLEAEELERVMAVNFLGSAYLLWATLPHLRESRGTFVDVNSALAYRGIPLQAPYCASKAALRTLLESVRVELEKSGAGVDVCVALPGAINTPHFERVRQKLGRQPKPIPPIYEPEPFAEAILHLAEHPSRELPIGWGAQKLLWGQKLSPRLGDLMLRRDGWEGQTTGEPKPAGAAGNLFASPPGDPGERGRFGHEARDSTLWTSIRLRRWLGGALLAGAAGAAVAALAQGNGHRPHLLGRLTRIG